MIPINQFYWSIFSGGNTNIRVKIYSKVIVELLACPVAINMDWINATERILFYSIFVDDVSERQHINHSYIIYTRSIHVHLPQKHTTSTNANKLMHFAKYN